MECATQAPEPKAAPFDPAPWLARLPADAGRILLVGPDVAALGQALSGRAPSALVRQTADLPAAGSFDAVALVDAWARARDSEAFLAAATALLAEGGVLLADVPNAEHWRFAERLLAGGWTAEQGPNGPGELRLFALAATREALAAAGLTPIDAQPLAVDLAGARDFAARIGPGLVAHGRTPEEYLRRAAPGRLLWRAMRGRPARLLVAAQVLKPVGGVNDVRIHQPLATLATDPGITVTIAEGAPSAAPPEAIPRLMILQRRLLDSPQAPSLVARLRAQGYVIVQEFDDDPAHWPSIAATDHFAFRGVHAVQTSTPALAGLLRSFNPELAIFPNAVEALPQLGNFQDSRRLRLFLGALRREEDFAPLLPALNRLAAAAGERLFLEVVFDQQTHAALATPHKRFHPLLAYPAYRALLGSCDVALLPLNDTRFNRFKSDLKYIESAAHGLAVVASPVVYGASVTDGHTGVIAPAPEAFAEALAGFLEDPARARRLGLAARAEVAATRMMASQMPARRAWYRSLWDRRAALDAALLARAPAVGVAPT
jgi:SAM-dependent methyltransferase